MENGPFIDGLPIKNGDFPWLCQITRGYILCYTVLSIPMYLQISLLPMFLLRHRPQISERRQVRPIARDHLGALRRMETGDFNQPEMIYLCFTVMEFYGFYGIYGILWNLMRNHDDLMVI